MNLLLKVAVLAIAAGGVSAPVFAYPDQPPVVHKHSFYVDGNFGFSMLSTPQEFIADCSPDHYYNGCYNSTYSSGSLAAGADVGYHFAINPSFLLGGELGYSYNGRSRYNADYNEFYNWYWSQYRTTMKVKSQDIHLLATGTVVFHNGFNIFVKGGAAKVTQKLYVDTQSWIDDYFPVPTEASSLTAVKPMAAIGLGYQSGLFNVNIQFSRIFATNAKDFSDMMDMDTLTMNKIVSVETVKLGLGITIPSSR